MSDDGEAPDREESIPWPGLLIMELLLREGRPLRHGQVLDVACPACGGPLRATLQLRAAVATPVLDTGASVRYERPLEPAKANHGDER